jgi:hypothetical protein
VAVNKLSSPAIIVIGEVVGTVRERAGFIKLKSNHNTILVYEERNNCIHILKSCTNQYAYCRRGNVGLEKLSFC